MTVFGQAALTARRLVEAGSRFVSVFWDEYGLAGSGWDTHWGPLSANEERTVAGPRPGVCRPDRRPRIAAACWTKRWCSCLSEHGRTPKLQNVTGGGRDHWSQAYSSLFAGGGMARGNVVGRTDREAGTVTDRPVSPKDVLATVYHLLGINPHSVLPDRTGRPRPLVETGNVVQEMLG